MGTVELQEMPTPSKAQLAWNKFVNWFTKNNGNEAEIMAANTAYCKSTYGQVLTKADLIKMHRANINRLISDRTSYRTMNGDISQDYYIYYPFPKDVLPFIDEILEGYVNKGYQITNISKLADEIADDNLYRISWYKDHI